MSEPAETDLEAISAVYRTVELIALWPSNI
jgi:hypothetical protein